MQEPQRAVRDDVVVRAVVVLVEGEEIDVEPVGVDGLLRGRDAVGLRQGAGDPERVGARDGRTA